MYLMRGVLISSCYLARRSRYLRQFCIINSIATGTNSRMSGKDEPPAYTVSYEQPFHPPHYDEVLANSGPVPCYWPQPEVHREVKKTDLSKETPAVTQQPLHSASVVYVTQNPHSVMQNVGLPGSRVTCPSCRQTVGTRVTHTPGCQTHMWACIMLAFGCWPFCLLPYCCPMCQDTDHFCDNCGSYVATTM